MIRSKGLFWIDSRPDQALVWSQAGGSLKSDSAGVWWISMPYENRTRYQGFIDNQADIEYKWDKTFGDRKNEIVFIGQEMDEAGIVASLKRCLAKDDELKDVTWKEGKEDSWPIPRAMPLG